MAACTQADRLEFNSALLEMIMGEHMTQVPDPEGTDAIQKEELVNWKFDSMDSNGNGEVYKGEFREFWMSIVQLARKKEWIKVCGHKFWHYCDMNADKTMTRSEWHNCIGLNINSKKNGILSYSSRN